MTKLRACVIGNPISHSKSPKLHNYWLKALGIDGEYTAVEAPLDGFEDKVRRLQDEGFQGANVTIPFKENAYALADDVTPLAARVKAANTLVFKDGKIFADNSDGFGFAENIRDKYPEWNGKGAHMVLGAGGASRAIIAQLAEEGAEKIIIVNRNQNRAETLARELDIQNAEILSWQDAENHVENLKTIINTSALGMKGQDDVPLALQNVSPNTIITDIVYTPLMTGFLNDAKAHGLPYVDGLGMLLYQARPGFRAWFGNEPPAIDDALRDYILAS